jgi:glycerol uptake facilitator-like aquaporin
VTLGRKLLAEGIGTLLLLATVVGSGTMGTKLAQGNDAIALLANAGATAGILYVLIATLGPISGAHFNPVVTIALRLRREIRTREMFCYVIVQIVAAIAGVMLAHAMFGLSLIQQGVHMRNGAAQWIGEAMATFGLLLTILLGARHRAAAVPQLVASYIFAAYWFTSSTSFANPAVTLARSLTQTFAGIRPEDVGGFIVAQFAGAALALGSIALLSQPAASESAAG